MLTLASVALVLAFLVWLALFSAPRVDRLIAVVELRATQAPTAKMAPMPADMVVAANRLDSEWARESAMKAMEEAYQRTGDWDSARASFPSLDGIPVEIEL